MDTIPLDAVRAAATDVVADTSGTAVAAPVADITGAAADIAADARAAALADAGMILLSLRLICALLLSLMSRLMLRLPLIWRATFTVALGASASIVASTSPSLPAASGFEASGQGMVAVDPVRAPPRERDHPPVRLE